MPTNSQSPNNMPVQKALMTTRIIWFALLAGPCMFMGILITQIMPNRKPETWPQPVLAWIHVAMFAVVVPVVFLIRRAIFSRSQLPDGIKPSAYAIGNIVFWAGCEATVYFGLVVAMLNGSLRPTIYLVAVALALQVVTFPTSAKLSGGATLT